MDMKIRMEGINDHGAVFNLIKTAFEKMEHSDHREQFLVERLRNSASFVPELSLVAEVDHRIVGYLLLTKIRINGKEKHWESLAPAPVAVLPEFQGKGIGGSLIQKSHEIARRLGFTSVILLGHADYYPRFGYVPAAQFGIRLPFDVPAENCMVNELKKGSLDHVEGLVEYSNAFFE